jgi:geranylgeranyl reductase family protein
VNAADAEILVVGAGPAGSAAALTLARAGREVLLVDRRDFPRPKLCGGALSRKAVRLLDAELGVKLGPERLEAETPGGALFHRGKRVARIHDPARPIAFVSRADFDDVLRREALAAGARFRPGFQAWHVDAEAGEVRSRDGARLAAPLVIGADGAAGVCGRALRGGRIAAGGVAETLELDVPVDAAALRGRLGDPCLAQLHFGVSEVGYGWVFPKRGRLTVGLLELAARGADLAARFEAFLGDVGLATPARGIPRRGHPLPYGDFVASPARGRLLGVGDAAGLVEPFFGEGIHYALVSGLLAARAALEAGTGPAAGAAYTRALRPLLAELRAGLWLRDLAYRPFVLPRFMRAVQRVPAVQRLASALIAGDVGFRAVRRRSFAMSPWVVARLAAR